MKPAAPQNEAKQKRVQARIRHRAETITAKTNAPMFRARNIQYEVSDRIQAIGYGGIGLIHSLAQQSGLVDAIDRNVQLLKFDFPYHESDHVLNIAYNAMTGGQPLHRVMVVVLNLLSQNFANFALTAVAVARQGFDDPPCMAKVDVIDVPFVAPF